MPIYEYQCTRCGHRFEVTHAVGGSVDRCERCGGPVRRVFSPVGIIFKGSGFYVTDNRKTPAPAGGDGKVAGEKPPAAPAAASSSGGSDGKSKTSKTSAGAKSS